MIGITLAVLTLTGNTEPCPPICLFLQLLGILHRNLSLCVIQKNSQNKGTDDDSQDYCHCDHNAANLFSLHKLLIQAVQIAWHTGNDVDKKDNGDTISDSLIGNLLTQPHNEHGAGCQADNHLCHDQRTEI